MICSQVRTIQMWRGGYVSHPPSLHRRRPKVFFYSGFVPGKDLFMKKGIVTNEEFEGQVVTGRSAPASWE